MYLARITDVTNGVLPLVFLVFASVGALVAVSRPRNPIGWIFLVIGFSNSMWAPAFEFATRVSETLPASAGAVPLAGWLALIADSVATFGWYMITLAILTFPNGHLLSRRWRRVAVAAIVLMVVETLAAMLTPGPRGSLPATVNPIGVESLREVIAFWRGYFAMPLYLIVLAACSISLIVRFWRARGDERQQIKWVAYAAVLVAVGLSAHGINVALNYPVPAWISLAIFLVYYVWFPISLGIAILKFRLYNIDVIINRTLVYGLLTGTLIAIYAGTVVLLQSILNPVMGQGNELSIVISTLAIAALFTPLRRRIQAFIDKRFYRRKYDAALTLQTFSTALRDEVDLEKLTAQLVRVVNDTVQPSHVSLWLHFRGAADKGITSEQ
jgi:hypothetical protein